MSHCGLHLSGKRNECAVISRVHVISIDGDSPMVSQQKPDLLRWFLQVISELRHVEAAGMLLNACQPRRAQGHVLHDLQALGIY